MCDRPSSRGRFCLLALFVVGIYAAKNLRLEEARLGLPEGWSAHENPDGSGRIYFYHLERRESLDVRPTHVGERLAQRLHIAERRWRQDKLKGALEVLGPEEDMSQDSTSYEKEKRVEIYFMRFQVLGDIGNRVEDALRNARVAIQWAPDYSRPRLQVNLALFRVNTGLDWEETRDLFYSALQANIVGGESAHDSLARAMLHLMEGPDPDAERLLAACQPMLEDLYRSNYSNYDVYDPFIHSSVGSMYGLTRNTTGMLLHFGMTCGTCARTGKECNETAIQPFGSQVVAAYDQGPADPAAFPEVALDSAPGVFMSSLPSSEDTLGKLRNFFRSDPDYWPPGNNGGFFGHMVDLSAAPNHLIGSVLQALHARLPAWIREKTNHAEFWAHVRPETVHHTGRPQYYRGHSCHTDNMDDVTDHLVVATTVLYLADSEAATLVVNQSDTSTEFDPAAWVVHPKLSHTVTFLSDMWHCVLPPSGAAMNPLRSSLNVLWLTGPCEHEGGGKVPAYCLHRPQEGYKWEARLPPEDVLVAAGTPRARIPPHVQAFDSACVPKVTKKKGSRKRKKSEL